MKIKGIKRGRTIELSEEVNIPDGQEVNIDIEVIQQMTTEERVKKMKELLANWEEKEDFINTMKMLEEEKNAKWEKLYGNQS
jgi:acylphosphatase